MPKRAPARLIQSVVDLELQDADSLAELANERFPYVRIEPIRPAERIGMSGTYGQVAGINFSRSHVRGEFRVVPEQTHDGVFFMLPRVGRIVFHQYGEAVAGSANVAIAAEGAACQSAEFLSNCEFSSVVIDRPTLAARLSTILGRPIVEKPVFQPSLDMASGGARALASLAMSITGPDFGPQLNQTKLITERVREILVDLVLETWPNNYSDILHRPHPMIAPQHVKLAVDFIHEHAQLLSSGTELAALSGVSLRSLQAGFRRFVGVSIGAYQRQIRLERARADLLLGPMPSIEEIGRRWGFTNPGRFSRYFKEAYGISPTQLVRPKS